MNPFLKSLTCLPRPTSLGCRPSSLPCDCLEAVVADLSDIEEPDIGVVGHLHHVVPEGVWRHHVGEVHQEQDDAEAGEDQGPEVLADDLEEGVEVPPGGFSLHHDGPPHRVVPGPGEVHHQLLRWVDLDGSNPDVSCTKLY